PLTVFFDGVCYWLADGWLRLHAYERAGRSHAECEVQPGSFREARLYAAAANATNSEPRKPEDRRRAVLMALEDDEVKEWSDARIARHCGVSGPLVAGIRRMLKDREEQARRAEEAAASQPVETAAANTQAAESPQ